VKTTLDLPDALVYEVKRRAILGNRKLKDTVAELLLKGLASTAEPEEVLQTAIVERDETTGLPIIRVAHAAKGGDLTPEQLSDLLLAEDVE
jgi:hypothetical protein